MLEEQYNLRHLVDDKGDLDFELEEVRIQEELALKVLEHFLGHTIVVKGKKFILSNLELYYGGIGDMAHDWFRSSFPEKYQKLSRHSKSNTTAQVSRGPIFYFNQKGDSKFKRCDIVIGREEVAVSILIRNAFDEKLNLLCHKNGQPNVVLRKMGLTDEDHMKPVEIIDRRDEIIKKGFQVTRQMRVISGKATGFPYDCIHAKKEWNLMLHACDKSSRFG